MLPKTIKAWHWKAVEDYCNGKRLRDIADKYKCHDQTIAVLARAIGITPRPIGFSSYEIAHKWVLQARIEFERLKANGTPTTIKQSREQAQAAIST